MSQRSAQLPAVMISQSWCWNSASTPRRSRDLGPDVDIKADPRAVRLAERLGLVVRIGRDVKDAAIHHRLEQIARGIGWLYRILDIWLKVSVHPVEVGRRFADAHDSGDVHGGATVGRRGLARTSGRAPIGLACRQDERRDRQDRQGSNRSHATPPDGRLRTANSLARVGSLYHSARAAARKRIASVHSAHDPDPAVHAALPCVDDPVALLPGPGDPGG